MSERNGRLHGVVDFHLLQSVRGQAVRDTPNEADKDCCYRVNAAAPRRD